MIINKTKNQNIISFFLVFSLLTIIQGFIPLRPWFYCSVLVSFIILVYPHILFKKNIFFLYLYFLFVIIKFSLGVKLNIPDYLFEFVICILCVSLLDLGISERINKEKIVSLIIILTTFMALCSIPILISSPGLLRAFASGSKESIKLMDSYFKYGLANYYLPHAIPIIIPGLIYRIKFKIGDYKKELIILVVLIGFVILSGATMPLFFSIILVFLCCFIRNKLSLLKKTMIIILTIIFIIIINDKIMIMLLEKIIQFIPDSFGNMQYKMSSIKEYVEFGQMVGSLNDREILYNLSWNTFCDNFVIGQNNVNLIGGHMYIVDKLALFGIVGTVPLFWFFITLIKKAFKSIDRFAVLYYLLGILSGFLMLILKGVQGLEIFLFLFVILPFLCMTKKNVNK